MVLLCSSGEIKSWDSIPIRAFVGYSLYLDQEFITCLEFDLVNDPFWQCDSFAVSYCCQFSFYGFDLYIHVNT